MSAREVGNVCIYDLIESVKTTSIKIGITEVHVKNKAQFETWKKLNENKVLSYYGALRGLWGLGPSNLSILRKIDMSKSQWSPVV